MSRPRRVHFRLSERLDGTLGGTVTVTQYGGVALFTVRPLRRRKVYELTLAEVAKWTILQISRKDAAEKLRRRKAKREQR